MEGGAHDTQNGPDMAAMRLLSQRPGHPRKFCLDGGATHVEERDSATVNGSPIRSVAACSKLTHAATDFLTLFVIYSTSVESSRSTAARGCKDILTASQLLLWGSFVVVPSGVTCTVTNTNSIVREPRMSKALTKLTIPLLGHPDCGPELLKHLLEAKPLWQGGSSVSRLHACASVHARQAGQAHDRASTSLYERIHVQFMPFRFNHIESATSLEPESVYYLQKT